jgi:hypothetical protein
MKRADRELVQIAATLATGPYISIADAARVMGQSFWATKRWLRARQALEPGLLVNFTESGHRVRKWWVSRDALGRVFGIDKEEIVAALQRHGRRLDNHETRISRLEHHRASSSVS